MQNKSANVELKFISRVHKDAPTMVFLDKEFFEQVLLLLINLIIRGFKNLEKIKILIKMDGNYLCARITHSLVASTTNDPIRLGGQKVSE